MKQRLKWVTTVLAIVAAGSAALLAAEVNRSQAALPSESFTLHAVLNSKQEVPKPKGKGNASGDFRAKMSITNANIVSLGWKLVLHRLSGRPLAAHIHLGVPGKSGPIIVPLCAPCSPTPSGTIKKKLPLSTIKAIEAGRTYVNVHTKLNPGGEIRGNIPKPVLATPTPAGGNAAGQPVAGVVVPTTPALVAQGKALSAKFSCEGCHTTNGQQSTGPTWKGLAGSTVHLNDGTTVKATDAYLVESITQPDSQIVEGYSSGIMTTAIGSITDAQARAIVAYIKTLK